MTLKTLNRGSVSVYLVQDTLTSQKNATIEALRVAVARATADAGFPIDAVPDVALKAAVARSGTSYFVSSTFAAQTRVHEEFGGRSDVISVLLLVPTTLPGFDRQEDAFFSTLRTGLRSTDRIITDSVLSRTIIESHLKDRRIYVDVVNPDFGSIARRPERWSVDSLVEVSTRLQPEAENDRSWTLGAAKSLNFGSHLKSPGLTWGRESKVTRENDGGDSEENREEWGQQAGVAETSQLSDLERSTNLTTVQRVFRGRFLEGNPLNIGIVGHKLSFIDELSSAIARSSGSNVVLDEWANLSAPSNKNRTLDIVNDSDVIIGEWARPNNIWIQDRAPADTRLIVRAHRYEVTTNFPSQIDLDRFDSAVVIVPWVGRTLVQEFGWPAEKMVFIPNFINTPYFKRPKLPGSEFTLGMVGITPHLKRLDLALDLLSELRKTDARFNLRIRGSSPLEHPHWSSDLDMQAQWGSIQTRLRFDARLRGAVIFDDIGRDMASWYEQIGCILSLSDLEGSHVALAEGAASGAVPIARRWPGIETLWPEEIIFDRIEDAVQHITGLLDNDRRGTHLNLLSRLSSLDPELNLQAWWLLLNGRRSEAQKVFGPVDWNAPIYEPVPSASTRPVG